MSTEETPEFIETKMGVSRHQRLHIALVCPDEAMVYMSHPEECEARLNSRSLTECKYSQAMDTGIQTKRLDPRHELPTVRHRQPRRHTHASGARTPK